MKNPNEDIVELGQAHEDRLADINNDFEDLKRNVASLGRNVFDFSNDQLSEWSNRAWNTPLSKLFEDDEAALRRWTWDFPTFYQSQQERPFNKFFGGKTAFGLYSWKSPSVRAYSDCIDKQGQSVWDSTGYWRCLFPNSAFTAEQLAYKQKHYPGQILTKDDFQAELAAQGLGGGETQLDFGAKGVFFNRFEDLMNWKKTMYENVRREREQQQAQQRVSTDGAPKQVVSSMVRSVSNADAENERFQEVRTEYYADGSSSTTTVTKSRPVGASEWTDVHEDVTSGKPKNGWFWNGKQ